MYETRKTKEKERCKNETKQVSVKFLLANLCF